jgi:hypothetical protein
MNIIENARNLRKLIQEYAQKLEDKTLVIATSFYFEEWKPNSYNVGDVRTSNGKPYECFVAHDSTLNPTWDISVRTLWKPYHSRKKEYALPYEQPTGSHDMYLKGEYMIWTDGEIYLCKLDTNFNPVEYSQAWEKVV